MSSEIVKTSIEGDNTYIEKTEQKEGIYISLKPNELGTFLNIPITNTLITSWLVIFLLVIFAIFLKRNLKLIPSKIQLFFEEMFEKSLSFMEETLGSRKMALKYFPLILTIFLFILLANLIEFIPIVGSFGFYLDDSFTSLFRSVNTDLNVTLALAVIVFIVIEIAGVIAIGFWKYAGKFINFKSFVGFFVGIIELISEIIRLITFSFRLFGNIFAGKVLIAVMVFLVPVILPVPFIAFKVFVGLIQAIVFALLTLIFIKLAITEPH